MLYQCDDGTVELYGEESVMMVVGTPCDSDCVGKFYWFERALQAYGDERVLLVLLLLHLLPF